MGSPRQNELLQRIDDLQTHVTALGPYEGDMLVQLRKYYRLGLTWTSNAIEGSSYTEAREKLVKMSKEHRPDCFCSRGG